MLVASSIRTCMIEWLGTTVALADRKAALCGAHLNSVIGNAQSNRETESLGCQSAATPRSGYRSTGITGQGQNGLRA